MTTERMLELLILNKFIETYNNLSQKDKWLSEQTLSIPRMRVRLRTLAEEFLNPYVIDNTEKSE